MSLRVLYMTELQSEYYRDCSILCQDGHALNSWSQDWQGAVCAALGSGGEVERCNWGHFYRERRLDGGIKFTLRVMGSI